jgi:protein required for attachment to host cells
MSKSSIWVLIAGSGDAAIWTSENGTSHLLRVIRQEATAETSPDNKCLDFAWQLVSELSRGVADGACDGVIVIACKDMLEALQRVMPPEIRRLLVAEISGTPETISAIPSEPVSMVAWGTLQ